MHPRHHDHIKEPKMSSVDAFFESPNGFGGRAPPGPAGAASALPRYSSRNRGGVLLSKGKAVK